MEWSSDFNTGISEIDGQHRMLVGLINKLHESMAQGVSQEALSGILGELTAYTRRHFLTEERMMERAGYGGLDAHKEIHRKMTARVEQFMAELHAGRVSVSMSLMTFLKEWLRHHILKTDMQYVPALRSAKI